MTSSLGQLFKRYFIAGLVIIVPIAGTISILKAMVLWLDSLFLSLLPKALLPDFLLDHHVVGLGLVITIMVILLCGVLTRLYIGKWLMGWGDRLIARVPLGRAIYSALKQLIETLLLNKDNASKAVMVEYPQAGSFAIGFVTGAAGRENPRFQEGKWVRVFIPTTPNPTSGFLLIVPAEKVYPCTLSSDEVFKALMSGGLTTS